MGGWARQRLTGKGYGPIHYIYSKFFYAIKRTHNKWTVYKSRKKSIVLEGNSKIGIHHSALLTLNNSKIIIHNGTLKVGIDFGYFDGGIYDPQKDSCRISLTNSTLEIFGNVSLYPGMIIHGTDAVITIKNNTIVNGGSQIIARKRVEIGEDCLLAYGVMIRDNDGHTLFAVESGEKNEFKEVVIGNHCWFGQRAMVLKGVTIEDNAVIAAGAVVSNNVKSGSVVAGVPAKVIKENVSWQA
jgi:acetyltransferase-like isoleucine patch superfamily enzyme